MLKPIMAAGLTAPGIRHGFFSREGGVSGGIYAGLNTGLGSSDNPDDVLENRRRVAEHLGAAHANVVTLYQVHGATALAVTGPVDRARPPKADAVVSNTPGLAIGVLTADCTPVLLADTQSRVVAAAHAGWRGAVAGVLEAAVAEMVRQGAKAASIRAAIGPTISARIYEVGPDFEAGLLRLDPGNERYFHSPSPGARVHFDLPGYVAGRLNRIGIAQVEICAPCTYENESRFFSYRRSQALKEGDYGRQISAIVVA
ncbi:MAG TPA: peptidoglycan editing factor PgeF [Hyphomicrobium sp.]|nr:peptidoglycan editing factor PgeF [Hyphomicrobium sp.]